MVHVIDFYQGRGEGAAHYAEVLEEKRKAGRWTLGDHIGPHDARARDWSTGEPRIAVLDRLGVRMTVQGTTSLTEAGYRADGIDAVRRILPLCRFDAARCKQGIAALRNYHRAWDDVRKVFSAKPEHDGGVTRPATTEIVMRRRY
jgi:phage terminase large subunit